MRDATSNVSRPMPVAETKSPMMTNSGMTPNTSDAIDVAATQFGPVDRALYLVDRTGSVSTAAGTTTVPLLVNPNFGELLAERSPGMLFRVGLRIGR